MAEQIGLSNSSIFKIARTAGLIGHKSPKSTPKPPRDSISKSAQIEVDAWVEEMRQEADWMAEQLKPRFKSVYPPGQDPFVNRYSRWD
jgi:hypothetical protein